MIAINSVTFLLCLLLSTSEIACFQPNSRRVQSSACLQLSNNNIHESLISVVRQSAKAVLTTALVFGVLSNDVLISHAEDAETVTTTTTSSSTIPVVPLYTQKGNDLQKYVDIGRGFQLLRPFGFNEFDGAGGGYAVKFASLFDVDENVIVGSTPSSADKKSIVDFGTVEQIGQKLATKRGGKLISATARQTDGVIFYQFEFENPLDPNLPRTGAKDKKPTKGIELYELCVAKGRLWSVQATSNERSWPASEKKFRNTLASFTPKL